MKKSMFKVLSLVIAATLTLAAIPIQVALAAGEPTPPSNLTVQASIPGDLATYLEWSDNSTDETGFEIERCTGADCTDFVLIATRNSSIWGSWYADVGLAENTTYSYRVRAVNGFGASEYSNISSATTSYAQPNGQVSNLVATFVDGAVSLTWTENATNETRFEIERYENGAGGTAFEVIATVAPDTTSYTDTTALRGTSYDYRVVPWRYDVNGGAPEVVTVETGVGIAPPTDVKAMEISRDTVRLTWKGTFDADTNVAAQRQTCDVYGCSNWVFVDQVEAAEGRITDTGLAKATTYNYQIRAISATSVSPFVIVSVTTRR